MEIAGNKIKLVSTIAEDIDMIIEFEQSNSDFVCQYSKEKHLELLSDNDCFHFTVREVETGSPVGHMILFGRKNPNKSLEFRRLTINKKGSGYGREVVRLLKKLCFEMLSFHRLWLDVFDDNPRAYRLYESEGFIKEGTLHEAIKTANGYRSQRIYAILENEYKTIHSSKERKR